MLMIKVFIYCHCLCFVWYDMCYKVNKLNSKIFDGHGYSSSFSIASHTFLHSQKATLDFFFI